MGKFIEFDCELFRKPAKCHIRIESISYIGPADVDDKTVVGFADENTFVVHGTPAEIMAKIEAAEGAAVEPAAVRPATMLMEFLEPGDVVVIDGVPQQFQWIDKDGDCLFSITSSPSSRWYPRAAVAELLARGAIVRRDGKVISGWPVGKPGGGT